MTNKHKWQDPRYVTQEQLYEFSKKMVEKENKNKPHTSNTEQSQNKSVDDRFNYLQRRGPKSSPQPSLYKRFTYFIRSISCTGHDSHHQR